MQRIHRFRRNARWNGVLRTLLVGSIFTAISFSAGLPGLLAWFGAWLIGVPCGHFLAADPARRGRWLDAVALGLVIAAFALGQMRQRLDVPEGVLIVGMLLTVGSYLSTYFWFLSSPNVIREPG